MIKNWIVDLHTHTTASGHAYSTLKENIEEAKKRGIKILGMSDHGSKMPGGAHKFFFGTYGVIPKEIMGVRILKGMEANILDYDGNIDVDPDIYQYLDYIIVSMHFPCCEPGTIEENTKAFLNAMENSNVKILGHINDSNYPIDYEIVIKKAKEKNIIIELNNGTLLEGSIRSNGRENAIKVLKICMKYEVPILVGSDAHIFTCVGNFNEACKLIQEVQFPSELILNSDLDKLNKYIRLF